MQHVARVSRITLLDLDYREARSRAGFVIPDAKDVRQPARFEGAPDLG